MVSKSAYAMAAFCLMYVFSEVESSFIKPNNVPRVGRSSESDLFDQGLMGYVIKTIPSKTIPRMGRRNFDSVSFCIFTLLKREHYYCSNTIHAARARKNYSASNTVLVLFEMRTFEFINIFLYEGFLGCYLMCVIPKPLEGASDSFDVFHSLGVGSREVYRVAIHRYTSETLRDMGLPSAMELVLRM